MKSMLFLNWTVPIIAYFWLSLCYSLVTLAFGVDFTTKYGYGGEQTSRHVQGIALRFRLSIRLSTLLGTELDNHERIGNGHGGRSPTTGSHLLPGLSSCLGLDQRAPSMPWRSLSPNLTLSLAGLRRVRVHL